MTSDERHALLKKVAEELGEHFDAVVILGSTEAENVRAEELFIDGSGNWFARIGLAVEFIKAQGHAPDGEDWKGDQS